MSKTSLYSFTLDGAIVTARIGKEQFDFDVDTLSGELLYRIAFNGIKQRIADGAAIPRDEATGKSATPEEKQAAMIRIARTLASGSYGVARDGEAAPRNGLLLEALLRLYPAKGREDVVAYLAGKSKTEQAQLRKVTKVADMMAAIKTERTKEAPASDDSLLAGLEG